MSGYQFPPGSKGPPLDMAARYMAPVERKPVGFEREIAELQGNLCGPSPLSRFSNFESTLLWVMRDYQALLDGKAKPQGIFDAVVEADEFKKCWDRLSPPEQDFLRSLNALLREIAPVGK